MKIYIKGSVMKITCHPRRLIVRDIKGMILKEIFQFKYVWAGNVTLNRILKLLMIQIYCCHFSERKSKFHQGFINFKQDYINFYLKSFQFMYVGYICCTLYTIGYLLS